MKTVDFHLSIECAIVTISCEELVAAVEGCFNGGDARGQMPRAVCSGPYVLLKF